MLKSYFDLEGYSHLEPIYQNHNSSIYKGVRNLDSLPVILKASKKDYFGPERVIKYKQEYQILRSLNSPRIVKAYDLISDRENLVLVIEDFGGESLSTLFSRQQFTLQEFLEIAIAICQSLEEIHAVDIIHKDLNPGNIVLNPKTKQLKIIDFGISTVLSPENPTLTNPEILEGTLAYISPEQTGRMNRTVDYRTDFYSLGATFYHLLTGQPPFAEAEDAIELVHCHLAKQPSSVNRENIPQVVSDIVMKLMAKTAEDRYQSAWGIKADLEECLKQLNQTKTIQSFKLGKHDNSDRFVIPQKLYGREEEVRRFLNAFTKVCEPQLYSIKYFPKVQKKYIAKLVLLTGASGIGKSFLVREIYKPITAKRGYFISGKFDQFKRNVPYSALLSALNELVKLLLTENSVQLEQWQKRISKAVGINGQLIVDVLPELELVIGKQPPVAKVDGQSAQNRFDRVMTDFVRVFCSPAHPLVLFLDDLQWIDLATSHLMESLLKEGETSGLFLIGAYRDNEINAAHPLEVALENLRQQGTSIELIKLKPLLPEDLSQLIADTLHTDRTTLKTLAGLVWQKTRGNPFFVDRLLKTLYEEKAIWFDRERQKWQWDLTEIEQMEISENVVDLVTKKLRQLPKQVQEVLTIAAAIGAKFNLETLAIVCQQQPAILFEHLKLACQAKIILPTSKLDSQLLIQNYKFAHDRIQQAAYSLIPVTEQAVIHLKIGRLLWQNISKDELSQRALEIADNLNLGIDLLTERSEKLEIAKLNLTAGRKAKSATAYSAAMEYLQAGIKLLATDSWQTAYEFTFDLYFEAMETALFSTDFEEAEAVGEIMLQFARDLIQQVRIYKLTIQIYIARSQKAEAIDTGLKALEMLDIPLAVWDGDLPQLPSVEELATMPEMVNTKQLLGLDLLISIIAPIHHTRPDLFPGIALTMVKLCLEFGKSPLAANALGVYGLFLNTVVGDIESAYHSGKLALAILERYQLEELKAHITLLSHVFVAPSKEHLQQTLKPIEQGITSGYQFGQLEMASYCIMGYVLHLFLVNPSLRNIVNQHQEYLKLLIESKQEHSTVYSQIWQQVALNFSRSSSEKLLLRGKAFNEAKMLPVFKEADDRQLLVTFYLAKLILAYNFKDYQGAVAHAKNAADYQYAAFGLLTLTVLVFYESLALLAQYPQFSLQEQKQALAKVDENLAKMKYWAERAEMNFLHQYHLVLAEKARVLSENWQAGEFYQKAIAQAKKHGYLQQQALANELAGEFYLSHGIEQVAKTYIKEARYLYSLWQATAKVEDLEARYPQFLTKPSATAEAAITNTFTTTSTIAKAIDLVTVIKASQVVAREISLDKLLATLMRILVENAGAQLGYLILPTDEELCIEASYNLNEQESPQVLRSLPIAQSQNLATTIVNYVWRTQENVVIDDASRQAQFANDFYLENNQPRSILCTPLIDRGNLSGIIYLENHLTTNAFTQSKLKTVNLLSSLAAIAIDNARLYNSLEHKVRERTQELSETLANLEATQEQLIESEKMAALGNLVAGVAHEINTPVGNSVTAASTLAEETTLFNMSVMTGQLKRSTLNNYLDLATEASQIILSNLQRAGELIQSFKQVAVDRTSLETRTFALKSYLSEILITLEPQLKKTPHRVTVTGDDNVTINSYPGVLAQIVTNFVTNSITHAYPTNKPGHLQLDIEQQSQQIVIQYQDDGCGIPQEHLDKIFEPFFTTNREGGGSGLGMHIVYNLITQKLKGTIKVKSQPNVGTTFVMSFPL